MSLGLDMFLNQRKAKKCHDVEVVTPVAYASGFLPLDYLNGQKVQVYDDNDNLIMEYDSVGFVEGTMITVVADPSLGKTTICQQITTSISSRFENSFTIHEDIEKSAHMNRVYNISNLPPSWLKNHYRIYQDNHAETVVDRFIDHAKAKLNNRELFEYDTGLRDMYNNPIKRLIPTFELIDSLSVMRSEEIDIVDDKDGMEKAANNMAGARNAKFNSEMFKQILPYCKKANIILFVINHINRKVNTGFIPTPRDLIGLGENETISGGRASLYLANNVLRLKNKGQLKPDKEYGIDGNIVSATFLKSRTNATNVECELIFDKSRGFSRILTMLHFGFLNGIVKKSGNKYYIPGHEDITFSKKTFIDTSGEHPEILSTLYDLCLPHLRKYLSAAQAYPDAPETEAERMESYMNIMSML